MTDTAIRTANKLLPLDRIIGQRVLDRDGRSAGRLHECRVETRDGAWVVTEYVLGIAGLLERLNVGLKLVVGGRARRRVARADQLDISVPDHLRLNCRQGDLRDL